MSETKPGCAALNGVAIGPYLLVQNHDGSFWLQHESGEGMQTSAKVLEDAIRAFWREHF